MRIAFRIFVVFTFIGSIYWGYTDKTNIEPYVSAIASFATFIASFIDVKRKLQPDINVHLIKVGNSKYRFLLENVGEADAMQVNLVISPRENTMHPIIKKRINETFPIDCIFPNDYKEVVASLNFQTGYEFDAKWDWKNKKGKPFSKTNIVSLKT